VRVIIILAAFSLTSCLLLGPAVIHVPSDDVAQITQAMRSVTSARITAYVHRRHDPPRVVRVWTVGGKEYLATYKRGKWHIQELVIVWG
jgi:hypothetical protein